MIFVCVYFVLLNRRIANGITNNATYCIFIPYTTSRAVVDAALCFENTNSIYMLVPFLTTSTSKGFELFRLVAVRNRSCAEADAKRGHDGW